MAEIRVAAAGADPILVVGAGPTGLMLAAELARHGAPCRVVDRASGPSTRSKALALQARTLEVFDDLGIVGTVLEQGLVTRGMSLYTEGTPRVHFGFDGLDSPYPYGVNLAQSRTEAILLAHLRGLGGAVEWGVELASFEAAPDAVSATLRHPDGREEHVRTPWLLGCDGAHSGVRHALGLDFGGSTDHEGWALADVRIDWPLPTEGQLFASADGLIACFPMPEGRWRVIAQTPHGEPAKAEAPTVEQFEEWLRRRAHVDARVFDPVWTTTFRINSRHVSHYRRGRVFLAGDAAHIHSPASGQGMNTGLQDAYNLAWKLALVARGRAPGSLLDSYEAERLPVARHVVRTTELMIRTGERNTGAAAWLRELRIRIASRAQALPRRIALGASQLTISYRGSPIVGERRRRWPLGSASVRAGDRLPDVGGLRRPDGSGCRLFDLVRGTQHVLLAVGGEHGARELAARYGDLIRVEIVVDAAGELARRLGLAQALVLVRPDGYVGFVAAPTAGAALEAHVARYLRRPA